MIKFRKIIRSFISYMPIAKTISKKKCTSPQYGKYYYDIYLYHIESLKNNGFLNQSGIIAEIGPGDTFGIGLCALLVGFNY